MLRFWLRAAIVTIVKGTARVRLHYKPQTPEQ